MPYRNREKQNEYYFIHIRETRAKMSLEEALATAGKESEKENEKRKEEWLNQRD